MTTRAAPPEPENARTRLLDAAYAVVRRQGYAATLVADLCEAAGVTKAPASTVSRPRTPWPTPARRPGQRMSSG